LNEMVELARAGLPFEIFSLKRCADERYQPGAQALMEASTHYAPSIFSPAVLWANLTMAAAHPLRYLSTLSLAFHAFRGSWEVFAKTLFVFALAPWFARLAQRQGLKHIHAHWASVPSSGGLFIARLAGLPFSLTAHAFDIFIDRTLLSEKIHAAAYLVTCTQYNRRFLLKTYPDVDPEKILANYHGVDLDVFDEPHDQTSEEPMLLCVGRLCDTKGYPDLIEACGLLKDRGLEFSCKIVGDGYMRAQIEAQIAHRGLGDHVQIMGLLSRDEVLETYRRARLFVLPCVVTPRGDRDGLPNVVVEAMAMGLPIIATDVSALAEGVIDGETGLLRPPHDPKALAVAIESLWQDPSIRASMGELGRQRARNTFGLRANIERLADFTKDRTPQPKP
jgi:colanic acid/amylovoran biosynthesis glycosyltransferase